MQGGHAVKQMATTNVLAGLEGRSRVLSRLRSALIRRNEGKYEFFCTVCMKPISGSVKQEFRTRMIRVEIWARMEAGGFLKVWLF